MAAWPEPFGALTTTLYVYVLTGYCRYRNKQPHATQHPLGFPLFIPWETLDVRLLSFQPTIVLHPHHRAEETLRKHTAEDLEGK